MKRRAFRALFLVSYNLIHIFHVFVPLKFSKNRWGPFGALIKIVLLVNKNRLIPSVLSKISPLHELNTLYYGQRSSKLNINFHDMLR
jgi:hypothetical protein